MSVAPTKLFSQLSKITITDNHSDDLGSRSSPKPHEHPVHGYFVSNSGYFSRDDDINSNYINPPEPHPHPADSKAVKVTERRLNTNLIFDQRIRAALCISPEKSKKQLRSFKRALSLSDIKKRKDILSGQENSLSSILPDSSIHFDAPQINSSAWLSIRQEKLQQEQFDRKNAIKELLHKKPKTVRAINAKVTSESLSQPLKSLNYRDLVAVEPNVEKVKRMSRVQRAPKVLSKGYLESLENPPVSVETLFYDDKLRLNIDTEIISPLIDTKAALPNTDYLSSSLALLPIHDLAQKCKSSFHMSEFNAVFKVGREDIRWESLVFNDWNPDWVKARQDYLARISNL